MHNSTKDSHIQFDQSFSFVGVRFITAIAKLLNQMDGTVRIAVRWLAHSFLLI